MKRSRVLFESILVYGVGGMIGNIIPFLMLPVITRMLPDTSYMGYSDIVVTIVSFASAVMTMGLYDASFRYIFDYENIEEKKSVFNSAFGTVLIISCAVGLILLFISTPATKLMFGEDSFKMLWIIGVGTAFVKAINNVHNVPLRSQNRKKVYLFINVVVPILPYFVSVPLILQGNYLYALPLAALFAVVLPNIMYCFINRSWIRLGGFSGEKSKALLKIGAPLMPCFLIYWVFNSCDKLMILHFIGAGANGIYAVGEKIGHLSQLIYQAFSSGWQYFAYTTMQDEDQVDMISHILEYLSIVSSVASIMMMVFSDHIFTILFTGDYRLGTIVAPFLFSAPLVLMLYQTVASQFMIMNKSWACALVLCAGAIINVVCNYFLIPILGIEGAAIATFFGYVVTLAVTLFALVKLKQIKIFKNTWLTWIIFGITGAIWRLFCYNNIGKYFLGLIAVAIYILISRNELKMIWIKLRDFRERSRF